ncbi:MAG: MerC mercury resistance protein [Gammaproteobacteria bacterium]|nr:MerC mercury resistance protein [Gammaproteobacteria bacterium]
MKSQLRSDKLAMGLSLACVIHCFFAPSIIILAYGISSFAVEAELIHYLLLFLTLPISAFALHIGYKNHKVVSFVYSGFIGLSLLILAVVLESILGEPGERGLTVIGSIILAFSHYKNHRICKELECEECHS